MTNDKTPTSDAAREMPTLLPCPFCGKEPDKPVNDHARMWVIHCSNYLCGLEYWEKNDGHPDDDFIRMISNSWNTRTVAAPQPGDDALLAALKLIQKYHGEGKASLAAMLATKAIEQHKAGQ